MVDKVLTFMVTTYWGGLLLCALGVISLWHTLKNPTKAEDAWFAADIRGKIGGGTLILAGIIVLIAKLVGKI